MLHNFFLHFSRMFGKPCDVVQTALGNINSNFCEEYIYFHIQFLYSESNAKMEHGYTGLMWHWTEMSLPGN